MITPENNGVDYDLLAKYFAGETTNAESEKVEAWFGESDENWEEFQRLNEIWEKSRGEEAPEFNSKKAWDKVEDQLTTEESELPTEGFNFRKYLLPLAAALIGVIAITLTYRTFLTDDEFKMLVAQTEENTMEVVLPDGSTVFLNKYSSLEYPTEFADTERWVRLKGEGFFEVERDTTRQFEIEVGKGLVTVLGTSFNVKSTANEVEVVVETGKVSLASEKKPEVNLILEAGDKGIYNAVEEEVMPSLDIDANFLFWKNQTLVFDETPLAEVVEELNSKYQVEISLSSSGLHECKLSGTFEDQQIEDILEVIVSTFKLEVETIGNRIILSGNGCE